MSWTARHTQNELNLLKAELQELEFHTHFGSLCLARGYSQKEFERQTEIWKETPWYISRIEEINEGLIDKLWKTAKRNPNMTNLILSVLKQYHNIGEGIKTDTNYDTIEFVETILHKAIN